MRSQISLREFFPGRHEFLYSPVYLIRKGLLGLVSELAPHLVGRLLDYGCGARPYESLFSVDEYVGLDIEVSGHDHADKKADVYFDGTTIPFPANHFDSVFASEVFEHVFELRSTLGEIHRVLKPGGHILFTIPFVFPEHESRYDYARYTRFALNYELEKAGFEIVVERKSGGWWETLCQLSCLYFRKNMTLGSIPIIRGVLRRGWCILFNGMGLLGSKFFVKDMELHLSHGVVARKK